MVSRQVRILLHHLRRRPSAQLLQYVLRGAFLNVPACPGVPEVMPAEILDAYTLSIFAVSIEIVAD